MKAVSGRAVVARHRDYAFYRPSAVSIARVITDIPVVAVQVAIFGLTMYFMCNLDVDAGKFWIYMLVSKPMGNRVTQTAWRPVDVLHWLS